MHPPMTGTARPAEPGVPAAAPARTPAAACLFCRYRTPRPRGGENTNA